MSKGKETKQTNQPNIDPEINDILEATQENPEALGRFLCDKIKEQNLNFVAKIYRTLTPDQIASLGNTGTHKTEVSEYIIVAFKEAISASIINSKELTSSADSSLDSSFLAEIFGPGLSPNTILQETLNTALYTAYQTATTEVEYKHLAAILGQFQNHLSLENKARYESIAHDAKLVGKINKILHNDGKPLTKKDLDKNAEFLTDCFKIENKQHLSIAALESFPNKKFSHNTSSHSPSASSHETRQRSMFGIKSFTEIKPNTESKESTPKYSPPASLQYVLSKVIENAEHDKNYNSIIESIVYPLTAQEMLLNIDHPAYQISLLENIISNLAAPNPIYTKEFIAEKILPQLSYEAVKKIEHENILDSAPELIRRNFETLKMHQNNAIERIKNKKENPQEQITAFKEITGNNFLNYQFIIKNIIPELHFDAARVIVKSLDIGTGMVFDKKRFISDALTKHYYRLKDEILECTNFDKGRDEKLEQAYQQCFKGYTNKDAVAKTDGIRKLPTYGHALQLRFYKRAETEGRLPQFLKNVLKAAQDFRDPSKLDYLSVFQTDLKQALEQYRAQQSPKTTSPVAAETKEPQVSPIVVDTYGNEALAEAIKLRNENSPQRRSPSEEFSPQESKAEVFKEASSVQQAQMKAREIEQEYAKLAKDRKTDFLNGIGQELQEYPEAYEYLTKTSLSLLVDASRSSWIPEEQQARMLQSIYKQKAGTEALLPILTLVIPNIKSGSYQYLEQKICQHIKDDSNLELSHTSKAALDKALATPIKKQESNLAAIKESRNALTREK